MFTHGRPRTLLILSIVASMAVASACGPGVPSTAVASRACALAETCTSPISDTIGQCVTRIQSTIASVGTVVLPVPIARKLADCANQIGCESFQACMAYSHGPGYCAGHPGVTCDGRIQVDCSNPARPVGIDCGVYDLPCQVINGRGACTNGTPCDPNAVTHCNGSHAVTCPLESRVQMPIDCSLIVPGSTCVEQNGGAVCYPTGATCSGGAPHCDGNTLVSCRLEVLREIRTDCVAISAHCGVGASGTAECIPDSNECAEDGDVDFCEGVLLRSCIHGAWVSVDCTALGFSTCGRPMNAPRVQCL